MMRNILQRSAVMALLVSFPAFAGWTVTGDTKASFKAKTTPMGTIEGSTQEMVIKDDGKVVTFVVKLAKLTTGIDLRDNHMRDKFLQVQDFPVATLEVPHDAIKIPESGSSSGDGKGTFTVHGQSKKDVPFNYTVNKKGKSLAVTATFKVNVKDHGIDIPIYMGVTMKPEVVVETSFSAENK